DEMIKNPGGTDYMLKYAKQFAAADTIVIAAPYWDLSFPAMVKNYLEAVTVQGVTFYYNEEGIPQGLCKAQKVYYVMTAGGPTSMPQQSFNLGFDYVKGLCQLLYGIKDVKCFKAEMLDVIGMDVEAILDKAKETLDNEPVE
ncbi:MAG: NAD(P)H-dependent oxidoreductase, partial [Firmicutes bacterium]|nr:NAD(P)H-dependent oxidoreductase [Bacillota bacterium]